MTDQSVKITENDQLNSPSQNVWQTKWNLSGQMKKKRLTLDADSMLRNHRVKTRYDISAAILVYRSPFRTKGFSLFFPCQVRPGHDLRQRKVPRLDALQSKSFLWQHSNGCQELQ